ncbi:MAG TPA: restriction endonuclease subunit S [Bryobacteraceae bacterium]|nr:restriction endonuclease subunit S [Bryobacteraceae bacterium]
MRNEWPRKKVSEIAKHSLGKMLDKAKNKGEPKPYLRNLNVRWFNFDLSDLLEMRFLPEEAAKYTAVKGDVLICEGGYPGRAAIWEHDEPIYFQKALHRVRFHEPERSKWFLYYLLAKDLDDTLKNHFNGAGIQHFTGEALAQFEVPLPPLPEQQRIVGILDEAFEGIATAKADAEKNLQNARAIFESHLQSVFSQRGKGWVETTLERVLAVQPQNGWSPPAKNHSDSGTPVLTLSSVTGFHFRPDKIKFTSASTDSRRRYWVKNGDFLMTRSNTPELVGHVAIASGITEPTIYPDLIMRMNPAPDRMMTEFLYYQMRSPSLRKEITSRAQGANPTMKKISNGAVRTLSIAAPSIATQRAVVETLNALTAETQRLASLYERKLAALEALKKSLLHSALGGNL